MSTAIGGEASPDAFDVTCVAGELELGATEQDLRTAFATFLLSAIFGWAA